MPKYSTTIEIDGEKLKAALVKRGLSFTEASTALGFGSSYISNAIHRGMVSMVASKMLESEFNIRLEDIKADLDDIVTNTTPAADGGETPPADGGGT